MALTIRMDHFGCEAAATVLRLRAVPAEDIMLMTLPARTAASAALAKPLQSLCHINLSIVARHARTDRRRNKTSARLARRLADKTTPMAARQNQE